MRTFRLYPTERHWWSFQDYACVIDVMERLQPQTVLEFGPGSSTLALIEGGAKHIDCCEDDDTWHAVYKVRLQDKYPDIVTLHEYRWSERINIPALDYKVFEFGLVDGPFGTPQRPAAIEYALKRCGSVLVPTEEWHDGKSQPALGLRSAIATLAKKHSRHVEIMETGPLSGAFALIT